MKYKNISEEILEVSWKKVNPGEIIELELVRDERLEKVEETKVVAKSKKNK